MTDEQISKLIDKSKSNTRPPEDCVLNAYYSPKNGKINYRRYAAAIKGGVKLYDREVKDKELMMELIEFLQQELERM